MSEHKKFSYRTLEELTDHIAQLGLDMMVSHDFSVFTRKPIVGTREAPNSFAVLPMEGCDSNEDGSPSDDVEHRYTRFASGGAGLLWWEANAVTAEGRANPNQMMITDKNFDQFARLLERTNKAAADSMGHKHRPVNILQLTHSGRYSRPAGHRASPIIAYHDPILDPRSAIDNSFPCASDEYLDSLAEKYVHSARLAQKAGFDGVDIKACHRYLLSELLASHTREGKYGGSFYNRTRLIRDIIQEIKRTLPTDFIVASRFNVFDAHPYPYGFGQSAVPGKENDFDPSEPEQLVHLLCSLGVQLMSNSAGNPYYIFPQVTRPFDTSSMGIPVPQEHPLESTERLFAFTRTVSAAAHDSADSSARAGSTAAHDAAAEKQAGSAYGVPVVGNGYTWLRQFAPYFAAANIASGQCTFAGFGRSSFAYPDAPKDILTEGAMKKEKCCIACSSCTQIMRDHGKTGCIIREPTIYGPRYKQARAQAAAREEVK